RDIEGRNIYLSSPEYMASYARRFAQQGVRLVGGCCGTTPEHIRQMKAAIKQVNIGGKPSAIESSAGGRATAPHRAGAVGAPPPGAPLGESGGPDKARPPEHGAVPRVDKSQLGAALDAGRFATIVELL